MSNEGTSARTHTHDAYERQSGCLDLVRPDSPTKADTGTPHGVTAGYGHQRQPQPRLYLLEPFQLVCHVMAKLDVLVQLGVEGVKAL